MLNAIKHPATTLGPKQMSMLRNAPMSKDIMTQTGWKLLLAATEFDKPARVIQDINIGPNGTGIGHNEFIGDAMRVYCLALLYCATGDKKYFNKYSELQSAWCRGCKTFQGTNAPLECAWGGTCMVRAAELMQLHTEEFEAFIDSILLPNLWNRYKEIQKWNNNWILAIYEALLQIALYKNNIVLFNSVLKDFCTSLSMCVPFESGMCTETKRDIVHAQFNIASMINIAELCWHQGLDIYSIHSNCIQKCMEFHASILRGNPPPCLKKEELRDIKFVPSAWDVGYNHFALRQNLSLPETNYLLSQKRVRPERMSFCWGPGWIHFGSG
jgi:hypothetical protein